MAPAGQIQAHSDIQPAPTNKTQATVFYRLFIKNSAIFSSTTTQRQKHREQTTKKI
jgi:hypothetical protein